MSIDYMTDDPKREALACALTRWARDRNELDATRDPLVRAALDAGISRHRIHVLTGLARTTINSIIQPDSTEGPQAMPDVTTDVLVRTANPAMLDETVQQLGRAAVVGGPDYIKVDGCYVVRVFGDPGFIKFAIANQGYGEVVRELPELT